MDLASEMNCFQWQNSSSDYLDGTLSEESKAEADLHLKECSECNKRLNHFKQMISSIVQRPKSQLPETLRSAPFSAELPRLETQTLDRSMWQRIPWYLRTVIEGLGIVTLVLLAISSAPKIRSMYEARMERSLKELNESIELAEIGQNERDSTLPQLQTKSPMGFSSPLPVGVDTDEDGFDEEDTVDADQNLQVGEGQLWRFSLKTVSPDEMRRTIIQALMDLKLPATTPGLGGLKVPGGVEFDLTLPQSMVIPVKIAIEKLAPKASEFSWYKVKSRTKIPSGKAQVVIWLAQPN